MAETWYLIKNISFPVINGNSSSTVTIVLHPDKINLSFDRKIDLILETFDKTTTTPISINPLSKNSQVSYYSGPKYGCI